MNVCSVLFMLCGDPLVMVMVLVFWWRGGCKHDSAGSAPPFGREGLATGKDGQLVLNHARKNSGFITPNSFAISPGFIVKRKKQQIFVPQISVQVLSLTGSRTMT